MEKLPNEIVFQILSESNLNVVDVINFSSINSKFREIVNSNKSLWKTKYFQRWPKTDFSISCEDWYKECTFRIHFERKVQKLLSSMSSEFFHLDEKNISSHQLNFINNYLNSNKYGYYYLRDFLIDVHSLPLTQSLTDKYYGNILMKEIHKRHNTKIWNDLMQLSSKKQTLEKGAIFVAAWCQEYKRGIWQAVSSELDEIACKVKHCLLQYFLTHPIRSISEEIQLKWKNENLSENAFQSKECKSIIWAINHVLFEDLKFCIEYGLNNLDKRSFGIDYALQDRRANPFIFAVIYESVARRLGVKIEVLEIPDDCLLRWKNNQSTDNSNSYYIKTSACGTFMTFLYPRRPFTAPLPAPCTMLKIAQKAALYLRPRGLREGRFTLRDVLELQLVLKPSALEYYQQMSQIHMLHELDAKELISKLKVFKNHISDIPSREFQSLLHSLELHQENWERNHTNHVRKFEVQHRVEGVDLAVGMMVRDRFWELTGVIHGWRVNAEGTQENQKVSYEILLEDGRYRCIPQENLQILHSPPYINHSSFGRFFDEYCITYYKPNKELQARYPQDVEALQKILKKDRKT